ncbi:DUF2799 domain-containing protein [Lysobacter sp. A286]
MTCRHYFAALAIVAALSGCTTLSQGECLTGDWYAVGRNDGSRGMTTSRLFEHHKACAEYGARPDPVAYDAGREAGLLLYCTPYKGFTEGRDGHPYRNVCPLDTERDFMAGYRSGSIIHDAQEALDDVQREIKTRQFRIDDKDTSDKERARLLRELRDLHRDRSFLEREVSRLRYQHAPPGGGYR